MVDHSDDCAIVATGTCTCTQGIGQPAAAITRKRLAEEYQRGKDDGASEGFRLGRTDAINEMVSMMNVTSAVPREPDTATPQYIAVASAKTQEAWAVLHTGPLKIEPLSEYDPQRGNRAHHRHVQEGKWMGDYSASDLTDTLGITDQPVYRDMGIKPSWWALLATIAVSSGCIAAILTWWFEWPHPFLWGIGTAVVVFCSSVIKLDHDIRRRNHVHRAR